MPNKPPVQVELADYFLKDLKRLYKKYPKVRTDVQAFVRLLETGETPGDQIPDVGYSVYKVRIQNSSAQRGKSGGYRIIYYVQTADSLILLTIYSKTERENLSTEEIRRIIKDSGH
jgi:mRNA-degrading endonuclease RelE of RelBE toxin-antitoxin system